MASTSKNVTIACKTVDVANRLRDQLKRLVEADEEAKSIPDVAPTIIETLDGLFEGAPAGIQEEVSSIKLLQKAEAAHLASIAAAYQTLEDTTAKRFDDTITSQAKKLAELEQELQQANAAREGLEKELQQANAAREGLEKELQQALERATRAEHALNLDALVTRLEERLDAPTAEHADDATEGVDEPDDRQTTIFDQEGVEG